MTDMYAHAYDMIKQLQTSYCRRNLRT